MVPKGPKNAHRIGCYQDRSLLELEASLSSQQDRISVRFPRQWHIILDIVISALAPVMTGGLLCRRGPCKQEGKAAAQRGQAAKGHCAGH